MATDLISNGCIVLSIERADSAIPDGSISRTDSSIPNLSIERADSAIPRIWWSRICYIDKNPYILLENGDMIKVDGQAYLALSQVKH